jgi:hypothetical protein
MTLYEFKLLSEREQLDLLQVEGTYIGKRKEGELTVLLFQLEGFYIEIFYKKHRSHILKVRSFTSTLPLEPYLHQIDITESVT